MPNYRIILTGLDGMNYPVEADKAFTGATGIQYRDKDGYENFVPYRRVYSIHWRENVIDHPSAPDFKPVDPHLDYDPLDTGDPERVSLESVEPLDQDPMA